MPSQTRRHWTTDHWAAAHWAPGHWRNLTESLDAATASRACLTATFTLMQPLTGVFVNIQPVAASFDILTALVGNWPQCP